MKIKYQKVPDDRSALVAHDVSTQEYMDIDRKIWNFIHCHKHHVLREYYRECKAANVRSYNPTEEDIKNKVLTLVLLDSEWEQHALYIAILQKELGLVIEDLPT